MKVLHKVLPALVLVLALPPYYVSAQFNATKVGSAEDIARIQAYMDRLAQSKPIISSSGKAGGTASASATKKGIAAYDLYPEPWRSIFIEDWSKELKAVKNAIQEDKERLRRTKNAADAEKYGNYIRHYGERLVTLERNDPPYFHSDAILAIIALGNKKEVASPQPKGQGNK